MLKNLRISIGQKVALLIITIVAGAVWTITFAAYYKTLFLVNSSSLLSGNPDTGNTLVRLKETFALLFFVIILITIALSVVISKVITASLISLKDYLLLIEQGILPNEVKKDSNDEIGDMAIVVNNVVQSLKRTARFAYNIGEGNMEADFNSLGDKDVLGNSLINMKQSIINSDKREKERAWIVDGIAEVGNILRNNVEVDLLSYDIIQYIILKTGAVQGASYIVEDKEGSAYEKVVVLKACYAYDKRKYLEKSFLPGESLIGQAVLEKDTIYRTEIPEDYCNISSGLLHDKKPRAILIVPLIKDDEVFGVIELASLNKLKPNEIKFVEEVGPIIARTIFNIFVNERTQKHLEQSQRMSRELQQQQEELRQNAEEMQATQEDLQKANLLLEEKIEEVNRTQKRMQSLLENASEIITIYERNGKIRYISPSVLNILGIEPSQLIGTHQELNVHEEEVTEFKKIFSQLLDFPEETFTIQYRYKKKAGEWIWLEASCKNSLSDPAVNGFVTNSRDITLKRKVEVEERMRKNMQALSENSPDLITRISSNGVIAYTNPTIENYTGLKTSDFVNELLDGNRADNEFVRSWKEILEEVKDTKLKLDKEIQYTSALLGNRTMKVNAIPEYNNTSIESVLVVSHDITEMKNIEREIQAKNKNIQESITYSKRIQNAIIPDNNLIKKCFSEAFIFYKPRDIVSGDFPWFMKKDDNIFLAVVDCTGHGVPGAMLSLVGYFQLNNIVDAHPELSPAEILDHFDRKVNEALIKDTHDENIKDGMDIALCKINISKKTLEYAGAHRPLYLIDSNEHVVEFKGDKWAIGGGTYKNQTRFTNHKVTINKDDAFFFFSDGFPDQFGGPENRKFGTSRIKSFLLKGRSKPLNNTYDTMMQEFESWKGNTKQTDDVLMIGLKF